MLCYFTSIYCDSSLNNVCEVSDNVLVNVNVDSVHTQLGNEQREHFQNPAHNRQFLSDNATKTLNYIDAMDTTYSEITPPTSEDCSPQSILEDNFSDQVLLVNTSDNFNKSDSVVECENTVPPAKGGEHCRSRRTESFPSYAGGDSDFSYTLLDSSQNHDSDQNGENRPSSPQSLLSNWNSYQQNQNSESSPDSRSLPLHAVEDDLSLIHI